MNGITILRSYEEVIDNIPGWSWVGLVLAILALIFFVGFVYLLRRRPSSFSVWGSFLGCFIALALGSTALFIEAQPVYETRYDAYIYGTVNMTEFANRYEVLEQDGLLFTIREK